MNFTFSSYEPDGFPEIAITHEELKERVKQEILKLHSDTINMDNFTANLKNKFQHDGTFEIKPGTEYGKIHFSLEIMKTINSALWDLILDRKLMINLLPNHFNTSRSWELIKI